MNNEYTDTLLHYAKKHLTDEQLTAIRSVPLYGERGLRKWLAAKDLECFIKLYFPEEFTLPFAPVHYQMIQDMQAVRDRKVQGLPGIKLARAIPRNHSKTTYYGRILPIHGFVFGYSDLTVLLASNDDAARRLTSNIKNAIESNEYIKEDFPDIRGKTWGIERLEAANGCVVTGYGLGSGSVRGTSIGSKRPSLVILDDIDDDRSVRSSVELANNRAWFDQAVLPLGDNIQYTTSFIAIGTLIRKTSLLKYILDSPSFNAITEKAVISFADNEELWKQWEEYIIFAARNNQQPKDSNEDSFYQEHKQELLAGTQVLWDRPDAYRQAMLFRLHNEKAFNSELQNSPEDTSGAFSNIKYVALPDDEREYDLLAALDPTTTGNKTSDLAAFVEVLFHRKRKELIVSYVDAKQRTYAETIEDITRRIKTRGKRYSSLWVETNAAGGVISSLLQDRLNREGVIANVQGIYNSIPKAERIDTLSHYISNGQLLFAADNQDLNDELNHWPLSKHDDILDALATIVMFLKEQGLLHIINLEI